MRTYYDIEKPLLNGWQFIKLLRCRRSRPDTRVMLCQRRMSYRFRLGRCGKPSCQSTGSQFRIAIYPALTVVMGCLWKANRVILGAGNHSLDALGIKSSTTSKSGTWYAG